MTEELKTVYVGPFVLTQRSDGILFIHLKETDLEIGLATMKELTQAIGLITPNEKAKIIVNIKDFNCLTDEAKNYAMSPSSQINTKANAIIINSLAMRIAVNFYIKIRSAKTPTKLFNSISEAEKWIKSIQ